MSRTQLLELEARQKSSLAALQERSLQYEELMGFHQRLRYRPCSPSLLETLYFGKLSSSWGGGGHTVGTGLQWLLPSPAWLPRQVEGVMGKPSRPHLG